MQQRLKVSDFYQKINFNCAIQIDNLDKAFFVAEKLFVTTKDAPIILQQYSLKSKIKQREIVLPLQTFAGIEILGNLICLFFENNEDLGVCIGQKVIFLKSHFRPISALIAHKGNIVTGSQDMTIRIWNPKNQSLIQDRKLHALSGHTGRINTFLSIQDYLLSGSTDKNIIVWKDSKILTKKQFSSEIKIMIQCSQSQQLAVYEKNNTISIINSRILAKQRKIIVNRTIEGLQNQPIIGLHQMDDSFLQIIHQNGIKISEINIGTVMAKIDLGQKIQIIQSKCLRRMTLLVVKMRGLFIIKF